MLRYIGDVPAEAENVNDPVTRGVLTLPQMCFPSVLFPLPEGPMKLVTPSIEKDALTSFSASTLPERRPNQLLRTKDNESLSVPARSDPDTSETVAQRYIKEPITADCAIPLLPPHCSCFEELSCLHNFTMTFRIISSHHLI